MVYDELGQLRIGALYEALEGIRPLSVFASDNSYEHDNLVLQSTRFLDLGLLS